METKDETTTQLNDYSYPPPEWTAPPSNTIKINVDAALRNGQYAIARDHQGNYCGASTKLGWSNFPVVAETDAFLLAAELAQWLNLDSVIIELDCQVVVKILKGESHSSPWRIWKTIDDIRVLTRRSSQVLFEFARRSANSTAHLLGAYAINNKVQDKWTPSHCPSFISALLDVST
ncbi:uncharacterized protein LOC113295238 [Papaver somniferum]|uniref:uncharacterized protein LOC113295238 n=1 Tax=Papaver somniferum TaxID=3469 RepID=UPI000E6F6C16|nr:uncharacterized protein LOC113295238 [Papaver somniferum]